MIGASFLSVPELDAQPTLQADWLELMAFFSSDKKGWVAELVNQEDLDWDYEPDDFGDVDEMLEDLASKVVGEVERRIQDLGEAYPFQMSADGRALVLSDDWNVGQAVYLFCLVLSHAPKSELVPTAKAPGEQELREARDLFQVCSTLAAAGFTRGPAFSVGAPRVGGVKFIAKLHEIWGLYGDGVLHDEPPPGTPAQHQDEGIDVISYWPERDGKPGHGYLLGQAASGRDWKGKSIRPALEAFKQWFKRQPAAPPHPAIFIPFNITDEAMGRHTSTHGYVAHRFRLPRLAGCVPELSAGGVTPIERFDEVGRVYAWLVRHRQNVLESVDS
jgi:hypothetical protein